VNKAQGVITSANVVQAYADQDLTNRLRNWARWVGWGDDGAPSVPDTCASAERHFPIPVWKEDEPVPAAPDELDGQLVETAISKLPDAQRRVIRIHFWKLPDWWMQLLATDNGEDFDMAKADSRRARLMGWAPDRYRSTLGEAVRALRARLSAVKSAA